MDQYRGTIVKFLHIAKTREVFIHRFSSALPHLFSSCRKSDLLAHTISLEDSKNLVTSDDLDLSDTVAVS